jgi:hypothetical protein
MEQGFRISSWGSLSLFLGSVTMWHQDTINYLRYQQAKRTLSNRIHFGKAIVSHLSNSPPRVESEVLLRVQKNAALFRTLSHVNSVHIFTLQFFNIRLNIVLPSTHRSSKISLPFRFSDQKFVCIAVPPVRATYTSHLIILYFITLVETCSEKLLKWISSNKFYRTLVLHAKL